MDTADALRQSFNQTTRRLAGHGQRAIQTLQEAFAHIDGNTPSDMYGKGAVIEEFQAKMARLLGKEAAVFFPSGTMAQQIALRGDQYGLLAKEEIAHLFAVLRDKLKTGSHRTAGPSNSLEA